MNLVEVFSFLIPNDLFQWLFLIVILFLTLWTIYTVTRYAKPEFWDGKWSGYEHDSSDGLDADHGSLSDLSYAVASVYEKLAEVMPGLLLVIGLLGTFIGLGISLNKASIILQNAQSAGMDQAMSNLMSMMQGLGTKFKTSTWGIVGFLLLKSWAAKNGFEERRLRWCITKIKKQIDDDKQRLFKEENKKVLMVISSIAEVGSVIDNFINLNSNNIKIMGKSSSQMAEAAEKMGDAADSLKSVVSIFNSDVKLVLSDIESKLSNTISIMSKDIEKSTNGISSSVEAMSSQVKETMNGIANQTQHATELQNKSFATFEATSSTLNTHIEEMTGLIEQLKEDIKSGLNAVSDKRRQTVIAMERLETASGALSTLTGMLMKVPFFNGTYNEPEGKS